MYGKWQVIIALVMAGTERSLGVMDNLIQVPLVVTVRFVIAGYNTGFRIRFLMKHVWKLPENTARLQICRLCCFLQDTDRHWSGHKRGSYEMSKWNRDFTNVTVPWSFFI